MNKRESIVEKRLTRQGWTVLRGGWPDFLAYRGSEVAAFEVKALGENLPEHQREVHEALRKSGLKVTVVRIGKPPRPTTTMWSFSAPRSVVKKIKSLAISEHRCQNNMIEQLIHEAIQARENVNSGS